MLDRLAASTNSYHGYPLADALAGIAAAGFSRVELTTVPGWTEHLSREADADELQRVRDLLTHHGLSAISLSGHSDLVTDEGADDFRKALRLCRELDIPYITTSTGGHADTSAGSLDDQREAFLARIGPLAAEAAKSEITVCLETHGGLLATGAMAAELVRRIGRANVGINYDPGNVIFYGDTRPEEDIVGVVDLIKHVHVKDQIGGVGVWHFPTVGTGEIDFGALFAVLDAAAFTGPCSVELEFQGEPWPLLPVVNRAMAESYRYVRPLVSA